ncbi:CHASE domain-containing protein, partial [Lutimaribacter saemankumensis]
MVGKTNIGAYLAMLLERRRVSLVAIAVFVLAGLLLALQVERRISSNDRVSERSEALEAAFTISSDIQRTLAFHKMLADSIASAIQADPELDQSSFATLVAPFFETNPGIRNIGVAKGSVIRFVYPLEENASVIGLDYLDTPTQASSFLRVREKLQAEFSGPVDLVQGGRGYIERVPVVVDDQNGNDAFWGMVSVVTDEAALIAQAINDLDPELGTVVTKTDSGGDQVLWG